MSLPVSVRFPCAKRNNRFDAVTGQRPRLETAGAFVICRWCLPRFLFRLRARQSGKFLKSGGIHVGHRREIQIAALPEPAAEAMGYPRLRQMRAAIRPGEEIDLMVAVT